LHTNAIASSPKKRAPFGGGRVDSAIAGRYIDRRAEHVRLDFLVPGFAKCGTTTLCSLLGEHPQIFMPTHKDYRLFDLPDYERRWDEFADRFAGAGDRVVIGDGSIWYTDARTEADTRARILHHYPDIKLIFIARDPIARLESAYREMHHSRAVYAIEPSEDLEEMFGEFPSLITDTAYAARLDNYSQYVDADRILVLLLEELSAHPERELARCFRFLGVDETVVIPNAQRRLNHRGLKYRDTARLREIRTEPYVEKLLSNIPYAVRNDLFAQLGLREPFPDGPLEWSQAATSLVVTRLVASVYRFLEAQGRPLDIWPRFAAASRRHVPRNRPPNPQRPPTPDGRDAAAFPERRFECHWAVQDSYQRRIARGRERMRRTTVVFCALARDVAHALPRVVPRIERAGELFREYRVVVYENDSSDTTPGMLREWARQNASVDVLSETAGIACLGRGRDAERMRHLAACRNRYLDRLLDRHASFEFAIVVDSDLPRGFSYEGLMHTFGHEGWDVVGSNMWSVPAEGPPPPDPQFFDAWAFRRVGETVPRPFEETNAMFFRRGEPMVPVWSSFGGLAVYTMEAMASGARYGGDDCEHVVLHRELRERGFDRQFLNPSQVVLYESRD